MQVLVSTMQCCRLAMILARRNIVLLVTVSVGLLAVLVVLSQPRSRPQGERVQYNSHYNDKDRKYELSTVEDNIKKCLNASDLGSTDLVQLAVDNAQLFLSEYRTVIPKESLPNHSSHCWNINYSASATPFSMLTGRLNGYIGGQNLADQRLDWPFYGHSQFYDLYSRYSGQFSSDTVCLPKTYLLGFEKCGSTYLWCFISKVIKAFGNNPSGKSSDDYHATKEPYFWTPFFYAKSLPNASMIGNPYLVNFMQAADKKITPEERKEVMLIDGTPSTVIEWPNFRESDPELANYCLLPSTLPQLFPDSKYVVVMRDPLDMLYSNYWWSFHTADWHISPYYAKDYFYFREGPQVFHDNSVFKIDAFLECLRGESQAPCPFAEARPEEYTSCIVSRTHLLTECVHEITNKRTRKESAIHRAIYYVHVRKWLSILPRDRILFVTLDKLKNEPAKVASNVLNFFEIDHELNQSLLTDSAVRNVTADCSTNSVGRINYKDYPETKNMLPETEVLLKKFFAPFNKLLADLLDSDEFLWN